MATPLQDDEETQSASGGQQQTASGAGSQSSVSGGGTPAGASSATTPNTQTDNDRIASLNQGADFTPFSSFLNQEGSNTKGAVSKASSDFTNTLGTFNPFGASDQSTINDFIQSGGQDKYATAHNLLNQSYSGPTAIDRSQFDPQIQQYQQDALGLTNQPGMNAIEGRFAPQTTQGERNFDWQVYSHSPGFKGMQQNTQNDANRTAQSGDQAAQNALNQVSQRKSDISAFDTAAKGYVQSQQANLNNLLDTQVNQANAADAAAKSQYDAFVGKGQQSFDVGKQTLPTGWYVPGSESYQWSNEPDKVGMIYARDAPQNTSPYSFQETVDPNAYASYTPASAAATRENVSTQAQVDQYNRMQDLLDQYDYMNAPTTRTAASANIDQAAFAQALSQAQADAAAAQGGNANWVQQMMSSGQAQPWNQIMKPVYETMYGDMGDSLLASDPSRGVFDPSTGNFTLPQPTYSNGVWTAPSVTPAAAAPGVPGMPASYYNPYGWGEGGGVGGGADHAGGEQAEAAGGGSNDLGGMYAKGGVVRPRPAGALKPGPAPNPLLQMGKSGAGAPMPQIANQPGLPPSGAQDNASILNPIGQVGYARGGRIPPLQDTPVALRPNYMAGGGVPSDAGLPGVTDSVPANLNAGEFVVRRPSAHAVGQQNLSGLNALASQPLAKQDMVRNALHAALSKAARG